MTLNQLFKQIEMKQYVEIDDWFSAHYTGLFEPETLEALHPHLSLCHFESLSIFTRLISAWIAFIFGDNIMLSKIMRSLGPSDLTTPHEVSLYNSLYALCGDIYAVTPEQKLKYATDSLSALGNLQHDVIYGNAYLTLGQVHSERNDYQKAAECFNIARAAFDEGGCVFLTIIADVNRLLNLYKLGQYKTVMDESERAVRLASSFGKPHSEKSNLYKVYDLPIGMALLELGKYELSLSHLDACKKYIDALKMFHLHGLIEWSRFKVLYIKNDFDTLKREIEHFRQTFEGLSSPFLQGIDDFFSLLCASGRSEPIDSKVLERLSHLLEHHKFTLNIILVEMMVQLQLRSIARFYNSNDIQWLDSKVSEFSIAPLEPMVKRLLKSSSHDLSDREMELLALLTEGETNEQIGKRLFISTGTVKWHLNNIYSKLEVKNRVQAIEKYKQLMS